MVSVVAHVIQLASARHAMMTPWTVSRFSIWPTSRDEKDANAPEPTRKTSPVPAYSPNACRDRWHARSWWPWPCISSGCPSGLPWHRVTIHFRFSAACPGVRFPRVRDDGSLQTVNELLPASCVPLGCKGSPVFSNPQALQVSRSKRFRCGV